MTPALRNPCFSAILCGTALLARQRRLSPLMEPVF